MVKPSIRAQLAKTEKERDEALKRLNTVIAHERSRADSAERRAEAAEQWCERMRPVIDAAMEWQARFCGGSYGGHEYAARLKLHDAVNCYAHAALARLDSRGKER